MATNSQKITEVAALIARFNAFLSDPKSLYNHDGSMGNTTEELTVSVKDSGGNVLFEGIPPCLGYECRSNYAHQEPVIKAPTQPLLDWLSDNYDEQFSMRGGIPFRSPTWFSVEVSYHHLKSWEQSAREETTASFVFYKYLGITDLSCVETSETTDGAQYTKNITIKEEEGGLSPFSYEYEISYPNNDDTDEYSPMV